MTIYEISLIICFCCIGQNLRSSIFDFDFIFIYIQIMQLNKMDI